jgi:hypothetical protein
LYKEREVSEQEISGLKSRLVTFGNKIKHLEKVAETSRLLFIEFREDQISGELSTLQKSKQKKIPIDNANLARANPDPIYFIINNYLPGIADRLQQIHQHTERTVLLTRPNLNTRFDETTHYLDQICQGANPLLNATQDLRTLQQNLDNITAE